MTEKYYEFHLKKRGFPVTKTKEGMDSESKVCTNHFLRHKILQQELHNDSLLMGNGMFSFFFLSSKY